MTRLFPSEDNPLAHLCFTPSFLKMTRGGSLPALPRRPRTQLKRQMEGRGYRRRAKDGRLFSITANRQHPGGLNRFSAGAHCGHSELNLS